MGTEKETVDVKRLGFVGLGVMGAAMCRNVAAKHDGPVFAFDIQPQAFDALSNTKARRTSTLEEVWNEADLVFLSLPGSDQVEAVCIGPQGLLHHSRCPKIVVDLSTTSVSTARVIAQALGAIGTQFADAPVSRTREAALKGELSIMVGASIELFETIEPVLRYMGSDISHAGPVGNGQFIKLINNALLDVNVIAIAEAMVLAEKAGIDPGVMIEVVSKGSGDSYALRNHAIKSMLPRIFPEKSFPPEYKIKDLSYLLELASEMDSPARSMELALDYYKTASESGYSGRYFTAVIEVIAKGKYGQ
jgi:3-hydroxyisobutyrate dehydrogenase-like beta-hydroxyacid dehydrogenase